jgi:small-conductance mechanosensitive channel
MVIKMIYTALVLFMGFFLYKVLIKILHNSMADGEKLYKTKKILSFIHFILLSVFLILIWADHSGNISTYIGLLSAGLAIALKDLLSNIAAFFFIIFRKPFEVGDRIEINGQSGDVIDQRIFMFTLMEIGNWVHADQSTGRILHIPNHVVFTYPLANYTKEFSHIWNEIEVLITFESDWVKAKKILGEIGEEYALHLNATVEERLKEATKKFMIKYDKLTPIVYTNVLSDGVNLTLRYLTDSRSRRSSSEVMWEQILHRFKEEPEIQLAYRTLRVTKD